MPIFLLYHKQLPFSVDTTFKLLLLAAFSGVLVHRNHFVSIQRTLPHKRSGITMLLTPPKLLVSLLASSFFLVAPTLAGFHAPTQSSAPAPITSLNAYAPQDAYCSPNLIRPAEGLNRREAEYVAARKQKADIALSAWLKKQGDFKTDALPTVGFASSGGGMRAMFLSAGVVQAFDGRESTGSLAGLYQAFTYHAGLSGGSWLVVSLAGNNWPTVSSLSSLWAAGFANTILSTPNLLGDTVRYAYILAALAAKQAAGFATSIVDPYGLGISTALYPSGVDISSIRLSGLASLSAFKNYEAPFPIITARGVDDSAANGCVPTDTSSDWEFSPFEYGSWDKGYAGFANTANMGSAISGGRPEVISTGSPFHRVFTKGCACNTGYDTLSYILGTSSNVFNILCETIAPSNSTSSPIWSALSAMVATTHTPTRQDIFGLFPNPFYASTSPAQSQVSSKRTLTLTDGGQQGRNIPIGPFIIPSTADAKPARPVDVLIVTDASADTATFFPNGKALLSSSAAALRAGGVAAQRMPPVPDTATYLAQNLNQRASFFGCSTAYSKNNNTTTTTTASTSDSAQVDPLFVVYLPNTPLTFATGLSDFKLTYSAAETTASIENGRAVALQQSGNLADGVKIPDEDSKSWPFCLACGIASRGGRDGAAAGGLPEGCGACLEKYCWF
jgi:lysophospholipase